MTDDNGLTYKNENSEKEARSNWFRITEAVAWAGIFFQALLSSFKITVIKPEYGAALAFVMVFAAGPKLWKEVRANAWFGMLGLFIVYCLFQTLWLHAVNNGVSLQALARATSKPVKLGLFAAAFGIWMARRPEWISRVILLMAVGLLVNSAWNLLHTPFLPMLQGSTRLSFGYSEDFTGDFAALGMLIFLAKFLATPVRSAGARRVTWRLSLALAALLMLFCLVVAGSRGAWIGGLASAVVVSVGHAMYSPRLRHERRAVDFLKSFVAMTTIVAMFMLARAFFTHRLGGVGSMTDAIFNMHVDNVPMSSVGMRIHLAFFGAHEWIKHPWMGYGLGSIKALIARTSIHHGSYVPTHLHDLYLQTLVGMGLVGSLILAASTFVLFRHAYNAWKSGHVDDDLAVLLLGIVVLFGIVNFFDYAAWHVGVIRVVAEVLLGAVVAVALQSSGPVKRQGPVNAVA